MITLIFKGGIMMIPIIGASILGLAIFIERFRAIKINAAESKKHQIAIRKLLEAGQMKEAYQFCLHNVSSIANILKSALKNYERSHVDIKESVQNTGKLEANHLEQNLGYLYTIATLAPLMGFLGTVLGMVKAFQKIEALGGGVNASVLAGGIWEALITTVAGLVVSIPMLIAYNYLAIKVDNFVIELEENSIDMMDLVLTHKERS